MSYKCQRYLQNEIISSLQPGKVTVIYGSRRVGKTTLIRNILESIDRLDIPIYSGENSDFVDIFASRSLQKYASFFASQDIIIIDEAQMIPNVELCLKLLVDSFPTLKVLVSGSSSFSLSHQIGEPLVGRMRQFFLYPFAQIELAPYENPLQTQALLPDRLVWGGYPDVVMNDSYDEKRKYLQSLMDHFLFKDILILENIRKSQVLIQLLRLLAYQIGSEVSVRELATQLGMSMVTVEKYIDILEEVFVIKRVYGFSRNLRKEITKNYRVYFLDNGVRNAVISNFLPIEKRNDIGMLWENYIFSERLKKRHYQKIYGSVYFWRTYDQKEIDIVEDRDGSLFGFECKWNNKKSKVPKIWLETYKEASYEIITQENYLTYIA